MRKLSGGQAAVESLKAEKVGQVFGLIGSATMEMFDALYDASDINFIGVRDERTGTHMADGYARALGQYRECDERGYRRDIRGSGTELCGRIPAQGNRSM